MQRLHGHDGWLAANPFGFTVLDREAGEFFLRTQGRGVSGADDRGAVRDRGRPAARGDRQEHHQHQRRRSSAPAQPRQSGARRRAPWTATGPAMRRVPRPAARGGVRADGRCEFIGAFAKPYPSLVIAEVMGAPLEDAPRLHHWSNWIQRQFDAPSLMTEREQIEEAVAEFYAYEDELIAPRRRAPGDDLISSLIQAEEEGDRLERRRAAQPGPQHPRRRRRHQPEPARARGPAARRASRPVGALRSDPRGLALPAVEEALRYEPITPVHRPDHDRRDRASRRHVPRRTRSC